ncbi:MAG: HmuY family protein [Myxococcota bacterium]
MLLLLACAPAPEPGKDEDDTGTGGDDPVEVSSGEAWIDATSSTYWTYLDLGEGAVVEPETPEDADTWDLGFRRQVIKVNGGVSGTGGMEVVPLAGVDYPTVLDEPAEGWITDEPDADDDGDPEYAFDTWFTYDSATHYIAPADVTWVARATDGGLYKIELLSYYDDEGTGGMIHLRWGPLDDTSEIDTDTDTDTTDTDTDTRACATDPSRVTETDLGDGVTQTMLAAQSTEDWVCFAFGAGGVTEGWDLSMQKWEVRTTAEVVVYEGGDFDALTQAPADGWVADPDALAGWYEYDSTAHTIDALDVFYAIRTEGGAYYKLQYTSYYPDGDETQPGYPTFRWAALAAP